MSKEIYRPAQNSREISLFADPYEESIKKKEEYEKAISRLNSVVGEFFLLNFQNPRQEERHPDEDKSISIDFSADFGKGKIRGCIDSAISTLSIQARNFYIDYQDNGNGDFDATDNVSYWRDENFNGTYRFYLGITSISLDKAKSVFYFDGLDAWIESKKEKKTKGEKVLSNRFIPAWERPATIDEIDKQSSFLKKLHANSNTKFSCTERVYSG